MIPKSGRRFSEKIMLQQKALELSLVIPGLTARPSSPLARGGRYTSSVAVTGTWSEGRNQPRECLSTRTPLTRSASAGATQI